MNRKAALKKYLEESKDEFREIKVKNILVKVCPQSRTIHHRNKWIPYTNLNKVIKEIVSKSIESDAEMTLSFPKHKPNPGVSTWGEATVRIRRSEFIVPVWLEYTISPKYSKKDTTYFEGILQLRNPSKELIAFIENDIQKNHKKGVFANQIKEVKNGIDYYLTKNSYLRNLGKRLKKQFKGKLKTSAKLFTRNKQTSRDVYRMTVMFRVD
jgi:NMD protein affecting ribosome stability and mRNA decay